VTVLTVPYSVARVGVEPILEVDGLRIERRRRDGADTIVSSMSLSVGESETVGIVGESGSGKSMTARAIIGLLPPGFAARGAIRYGGRNLIELSEREWGAVRGREVGLIMQDPFTILNPVLRVGRIVEESLADEPHRTRSQRREEAERRLAEVGIHDPHVVDRYPFQLSGGMRQRVAIAAALARDPRILIADEPSTALDVATQRDILALIKGIQEARGMGLILITHDLRVAFAMCDRISVLYAGSLVEAAPSAELEAEPLHPYSHGLLLSEPPVDRRVSQLTAIAGSVPSADEVAGRCPFAPRCRWTAPVCEACAPPIVEVAPRRLSACVRIAELRDELRSRRGYAAAPAVAPVGTQVADPLLRIEDLCKVFRNGSRTTTALDGVSIEVGADESVGIVGESGSGKTTLARLVVGLEGPTSGEIVIDGIPASAWPKLTRADRCRLRHAVQIVFQDPYSSLNPMRSIGFTLAEALTVRAPGARDVGGRVTELLDSVGLPSAYAQRRPTALSGGERQRVAIARALAVQPRILICDEPVSALDVSVQAQILNLFASLRTERGLGYLFITHDLSIVRQVSERLYVMNRGSIVESGPTQRVLENPQDPYTIDLLRAVPRSEADWLS
jgi:peptide/nickel transport system ATP-binding protein